MGLMTESREALFWSKVDRTGGPLACWEWLGHRTVDGHGQVKIRTISKSALKAHRVAYMLHKGLIPEGYVIRHSCDNRACCNPRHLSEGTYKSNMRECVERGRHPRLSTRQKLTPRQVAEIRQLKDSGLSQRAIGRQYGVDHMQVCRLWKGEQWKTRNQSS